MALLAVVLLCTSLLLPSAHCQFTSVAVPGCPAGFDCVGLEFGSFVSADPALQPPQSIDCLAPASLQADEFAGFLCQTTAGPSDADWITGEATSLTMCPSGSFCPTPAAALQCPAGSWCHRASSMPERCLGGSVCGPGTGKVRFIAAFIVMMLVGIGMTVAYKYAHSVLRRRAAARLAEMHSPAHAVVVPVAAHAWTSGFDANHPKINVSLEHVQVRVRDTNASAKSTSDAAAAGGGKEAGMKTILRDLSGTIRGGRLTAVMGPSGSGKTTFLSALLDKVPIEGSISVNHQHSMGEIIRMQVVGFVPQADTMLSMLTVRELVAHSAVMRLPGAMGKREKNARVNSVLDALGLSHIADSVVGDDLQRGISGGERKRVSIAMELVSDPLLLMLDEPTSGLDSAAATQVCDGLLAIARQGKVVCCVIHQPRYEIFSKFEDVLLLGRGGVLVYFGPLRGLRAFFADMGLTPPPNTNPADAYMDWISEEWFMQSWRLGGAAEVRNQVIERGAPLPPVTVNTAAGEQSIMSPSDALSDDDRRAVTPFRSVSGFAPMRGAVEEKSSIVEMAAIGGSRDSPAPHSHIDSDPVIARKPTLTQHTSHTAIVASSPASFWMQVYYLLWRCLLVDCRNAKHVALDSFLQVLPAVTLSITSFTSDSYWPPLPGPVADTCLSMFGERCRESVVFPYTFVQDTFFYVMIIGVASVLWAVSVFGRYSAVFFRDQLSGQSTAAYYLAKNLYDLIHLFRMSFIFTSIFFLMSAPRGGFQYWFAALSMTFWAASGVGYFISFVIPYSRASTIGVVTAVALSVTSGMLPQLDTTRRWGPLQLFWYISHNRWAAEAFVVLNASGQPTGGRMDAAITAAGYDARNVSLDIAMTFLIGLAWRAVAFVALRRSKPRTEF